MTKKTRKLKLIVELSYDMGAMHEDEPSGYMWFRNDVLLNSVNGCGLSLFSNEVGDVIGDLRVLGFVGMVDPCE
jgi:hypothetical protein